MPSDQRNIDAANGKGTARVDNARSAHEGALVERVHDVLVVTQNKKKRQCLSQNKQESILSRKGNVHVNDKSRRLFPKVCARKAARKAARLL